MHQSSVFIGKLILLILRLLGRSGSALPGLIVEKLDRRFLTRSIGQLPHGFVVVTGTNGKTTTTKIISELLQAGGLRALTNKTGSNFVRGVISATVDASSWTGKLPYDVAVFEQDEAHAVHLVRRVKPKGVIALNIMRDQLDRFGEIDTTAKLIGKVVASATDFVILNANDPRVSKLASENPTAKTVWFGHDKKLTSEFVSDDQHHSGDELEFFEAARPDVSLVSRSPDKIRLRIGKKTHSAELLLDGPHNAINATAAIATSLELIPEANPEDILNALSKIEAAFGRGETIKLNSGAKLRVQLIKNPAGFTHSLKLLDPNKYRTIGVMINDDHADGRDVSWLWDVSYKGLAETDAPIVCGGTRGFDMALRLKYDGIETSKTHINLEKFVREIAFNLDLGKSGIVFCTYTAMLQLRGELAKYSQEIKGSIL